MRIFSLFGPTAADPNSAIRISIRIWLLTANLLTMTQGVNFTPIPPPNLDLSQLGRVALAGDFDAISLYTYQEQNENGFSTNGSQSLITQLQNGNYAPSATADAYIKDMCPFVMDNGQLAGVIIGGNFTSLGGIEAQGVAMYDPNTSKITPLTGLSGQVSAIFCDRESNTVYVGGDFKGGNSTNAIAWVGSWANLPFAGFNGPVNAISKATNGNIIFGGSFTGLGNTTTPTKKDLQVINLSSANVTAGSSSLVNGFGSPRNIVCTTEGQDGPGRTWLIQDKSPGFWRAELQFGFEPTMLRLRNTGQDGRGTKTFRFTALPNGGIMNFTYTDPDTGKEALCDSQCPLSSTSSVEQDFVFVNSVGMNSFQIDVSDWYGNGGGLNGIELFQNDTFAYAVSELNEPSCANTDFPSNSTATGPWVPTDSGKSNSKYLTANLTKPPAQAGAVSVVFKPDIKQSGNYSVKMYTPGCLQDVTCESRGIVNITVNFASKTELTKATSTSTSIYQTNNYDKYDEIYNGPVDANSNTFRPTVTLTPNSNATVLVVAQRVRFTLTNSTGGLNGLFEYDPRKELVGTDYSNSTVNEAGAELNDGAKITKMLVLDNITYVAGNFSAKTGGFHNILAITKGNTTSLPFGGLNDQISSLVEYQKILYLGGNFTNTAQTDSPGLNNVAAFNISNQSWQPLGAGVHGRVNSIVPLVINLTTGRPENCISINGDFDQVESFGPNPAFTTSGFAVWVPSRQNWLQNLGLQTVAINGKLTASLNYNSTTPLLAGVLAAQDLGTSDAVYLTSGPLRINSVPGIKIQPRQLPDSSVRKRAIGSLNITGVVTGLFYNLGGHNITVLGGHFSANATNGSRIDNLAFVNQTSSSSVSVSGLQSGLSTDSVFMALAVQNNNLYAGGKVTGTVNDADVNGLIVYDLVQNKYAEPQPPALGGSDVAVTAITIKPDNSQVYVGGSFEKAGSLTCRSVCMYDGGQWSQPGSFLGGSVAAFTWQGKDKLLAGGNLTLNNNVTSLASYDTNNAQWTALEGAGIGFPGPVTALSPANDDTSQFWVAGKSSNGSAFLMKYDKSKFRSIGDTLGENTIIRGISVLQLKENHASNDLVDPGMTLLITGQLYLPNFGNASAALFNGTTFTPFILSTTGNSPGSLSQLFSEKKLSFNPSAGKKSLGLVVLIALACALGAVFLLVVAGILIERYRRKREGTPAPTTYLDKTSNMSRIPPEYLFGRLGERGPVDRPTI